MKNKRRDGRNRSRNLGLGRKRCWLLVGEHHVGGDDELDAGDVLDGEVGEEAGGAGEGAEEEAESPLEDDVPEDVGAAAGAPVLLQQLLVLDQPAVAKKEKKTQTQQNVSQPAIIAETNRKLQPAIARARGGRTRSRGSRWGRGRSRRWQSGTWCWRRSGGGGGGGNAAAKEWSARGGGGTRRRRRGGELIRDPPHSSIPYPPP